MPLRPAVPLILSAAVAITSTSISTRAFAAGTNAERASPTHFVADLRRTADVAGLYTINFTTQGSPMTLTLRLDKKDSGGYGGQMTGEGLPPLPITSVKVSGSAVKITFTAPDNTEGTINFVLASDNTVTGEWMMTGDGSKITGQKSS
jgi:hypothetical protein